MPASFDNPGTESLGQGILQSLAGQRRGKISYEQDRGTAATLMFSSDFCSATPKVKRG
jgi:two-component sensor histidine kinase